MKNKEWVKIVWNETDDMVCVGQGYVTDLGDFLRIEGNNKVVEVNKTKIVSVTQKQEEMENEDGKC